MKTTVIHHSADFDGIFCREIARKFIPEADLIGWDYADAKLTFPSDGLVYVLDLSPECFSDLVACGGLVHPEAQRLIWIDHHKSAIEKFPANVPGYRIDGVAACRLAWQWFAIHEHNAQNQTNEALQVPLPSKQDFIDRIVPEPLAVRLAGEYDVWDKRDERAEVFQFGLRSRELTPADWMFLLSHNVRPSVEELEALISVGHWLEPDGTTPNPTVCGLLGTGKVLQRYQQRNDANLVNSRGFMVDFEGLRFLALNTGSFNSLTFAAKDVPETGHDALMGFRWDGKKWVVSLYHAKHRMDIDLSQIAVKHGGGGHKGACGFTSTKLPFLP